MTCQHHWIIDSTNYGRCLTCGGERQFPLFHEGHWAKDFGRPSLDFTNPFIPLVRGCEKEKPEE